MSVKDDIMKIIRNFIEDCRKINIDFEKIILFGSYAKNNANNESDIDLALVSKSFTEDSFENALLIAPVTVKYLKIDAQTFPVSYFQKGDPFIQEILKTGIVIN